MVVEHIEFLRNEVEKVFGRKILSTSDCHYLISDIYKHSQLSISLNTLRRFFHLMKSKYKPSSFTVNILLKYCGFFSMEELIEHRDRNGNRPSTSDADLLNFLVVLFRDFDIRGLEDRTYINLVYQIIDHLEKWPQLIDEFQCQIAKTPNGQFFYYERFIHVDKLTSYFGDGIHYYLHERKDQDAKILGESVLCYRYWLCMNRRELYKHYHLLSQYHTNNINNPLVAARYFAAQLFFSEMFNVDPEPVLYMIRTFYTKNISDKILSADSPYVEFILSEALILTRQYETALLYTNEVIGKKNNGGPMYVDPNLFESINLFHAIALRRTGKNRSAKEMLSAISVKNFYFLTRKLHMILYLLQKLPSGRKKDTDEQLDYLIGQTGFKKLLESHVEISDVS